MTCVIETCVRSMKSRGWCSAHYKRWLMTGEPCGVSTSARHRILQLLEVDGGWMTKAMVTADFDMRWPDVKVAAVERAYHRLVDTGLVDTRSVAGGLRTGWNGQAYVTELRAL